MRLKTDKLSSATKCIEDNIKSIFSEIRKRVNEREKALSAQLDDISTEQSKALQDQMEYLKQYKDSIKAAMSEQDVLSLDPNMDSAKRQSKILKITTDALMNIEDGQLENSPNEMKFIVDDKALYEYIANIGAVTTQPAPPIVKISDINSYAAEIAMECNADEQIECALRYKECDDEKKMSDWKEVSLGKTNDNKTEYLLDDLQRDSKYAVCGRYKSMKENVWSLWSQDIIFLTLDGHEWDKDCKSERLTINGSVVTVDKQGSNCIWVKGFASNGIYEWKFKIYTYRYWKER